MKRYTLVLLFLFVNTLAWAQVSFQFLPEVYGRNVNGLFSCRVISLTARLNGYLTITVKERLAGVICTVRTPPFNILPGANQIPVAAASGASIRFSGNKTGQLVAATQLFPQGDYEYCFALTIVNSDQPPIEQCFNYTLEPFAELNLVDPYNKDKICDKRPLLTWQPLIPAIPGALYQLVLAEVQTGQSPTEALNYNLPVVNQPAIISPVLPYPSIAKELESGKRYAWQVTAYKEQTILNRSQIWEFTIDCKDSIKKKADSTGYRTIEDLQRGNFYIADRELKFALINPYQTGDMQYEIYSVSGNGKKIKHLPKVKLLNGNNQITIDLYNTGSFSDGRYYVLYVILPNGNKKSLRFLYKE